MLLHYDLDFRPETILRAASLEEFIINEYTGHDLVRAQEMSLADKYRVGYYFKYYERIYAIYYYFQAEIERYWAERPLDTVLPAPSTHELKTIYALHRAEQKIYQQHQTFVQATPWKRLCVA